MKSKNQQFTVVWVGELTLFDDRDVVYTLNKVEKTILSKNIETACNWAKLHKQPGFILLGVMRDLV